jgi:hypothetical protein
VSQFEPEVSQAVDFLYRHQNADGYIEGLNMAQNGFLLWLLANFGVIYSKENNRILQYLIRHQRSDGGWLEPSMEKIWREENHVDPSTSEVISCIHTTIHVLLGFCEFEEYQDDPAILKAVELVLANVFQQTASPTLRRKRSWEKLDYGYQESNILSWPLPKVLYFLSRFNYERIDPKVQMIHTWLRDSQLSTGYWGDDEQGNEWLTIWILKILKRIFFPEKEKQLAALRGKWQTMDTSLPM